MGDNEFRPVRYPSNTVVDGVLVPGAQAFVTAFPVGILGGVLTPTLHVAANGFVVALVVFLSAFILAWLAYRGYWTGLIETVLTADLNQDGFIGPPAPYIPPEPKKLRIEIMKDGGSVGDFIDLPSRDKLPALADGLINNNLHFAVSSWVGRGQLFSRGEFEALRAELVKRGLAEWKNEAVPNQGVELTRTGRIVFKHLADEYARTPTRLWGE